MRIPLQQGVSPRRLGSPSPFSSLSLSLSLSLSSFFTTPAAGHATSSAGTENDLGTLYSAELRIPGCEHRAGFVCTFLRLLCQPFLSLPDSTFCLATSTSKLSVASSPPAYATGHYLTTRLFLSSSSSPPRRTSSSTRAHAKRDAVRAERVVSGCVSR